MNLTRERLAELLDYDPRKGVFYWKVNRGRARKGQQAGALQQDGYLRIQVDGHSYSAHHLVWFKELGKWPSSLIDHVNRQRDDNRIENLREASPQQNMQNGGGGRVCGTSTFRGVCFDKSRQRSKWLAHIRVDGEQKYIGLFSSEFDAARAYDRAARIHHGEFACLNFSEEKPCVH